MAGRKIKLSTFDNAISLNVEQRRPENYRQLEVETAAKYQIPRGSGLSYCASSFGIGAVSVLMTRLNRIISFDESTGIVEVEAGLKLSELFAFLKVRGYFLPIQPGHGQITVGGCVASDVHGKNQFRDGNFKDQVISILLFHPKNGWLKLSRNALPDIFNLTCGGYGLTGYIVQVELQAKPLQSLYATRQTFEFSSLPEFIELIKREAISSDFVHSWHNFAISSREFGGGLIFSSKIELGDELDVELGSQPGVSSTQSIQTSGYRYNFWNHKSIAIANSLFQSKHIRNKTERIKLESALFPVQQRNYYYRFFGQKGFHEYQVILPEAISQHFLKDLETFAKNSSTTITLVSCKYFCGERSLLRFIGSGICIAINFPRNLNSQKLLDWLDGKTKELEGIPNLSKDSRLPLTVVENSYPQIEIFREELVNFDPDRIFRSELSERLSL
jgi:decaprenylphospho-beta-D-ribofuranose 2-oxidase